MGTNAGERRWIERKGLEREEKRRERRNEREGKKN